MNAGSTYHGSIIRMKSLAVGGCVTSTDRLSAADKIRQIYANSPAESISVDLMPLRKPNHVWPLIDAYARGNAAEMQEIEEQILTLLLDSETPISSVPHWTTSAPRPSHGRHAPSA